MKLKTLCIATLVYSIMIFDSTIAFATNLKLLGVEDGTIDNEKFCDGINAPARPFCDEDPRDGMIQLNRIEVDESGIFFTGDAIEQLSPGLENYTITVTNALFTTEKNSFITNQIELVKGEYTLSLTPPSDAELIAFLNGSNKGLLVTTGMERFRATATASSFQGDSVTVRYNPGAGKKLPRNFVNIKKSTGTLTAATGILAANLLANGLGLSKNETFVFEDSIVFCFGQNCNTVVGIPEPSSLVGLLALGTLGLGAGLKRKQK